MSFWLIHWSLSMSKRAALFWQSSRSKSWIIWASVSNSSSALSTALPSILGVQESRARARRTAEGSRPMAWYSVMLVAPWRLLSLAPSAPRIMGTWAKAGRS